MDNLVRVAVTDPLYVARALGYRAYKPGILDGQTVEFISMPFRADDGSLRIKTRAPGDEGGPMTDALIDPSVMDVDQLLEADAAVLDLLVDDEPPERAAAVHDRAEGVSKVPRFKRRELTKRDRREILRLKGR